MSRPAPGRLRLPKVPTIYEDTLGGVVPALAVRRRGVPLAQVRLLFTVGAAQVAKGADATVLAESLLAGTDRYDRQELAGAVERLGGRLWANHDDDSFVLGGSVLAANTGPLLEIVADVLSGAAYRADDVRTDRERIANEIVIALSQPDIVADEALRRRMYGRHPYGGRLPRPGALRRVSASALRALHPLLLNPGAARLVIVGDVEPRRALAMAAETLGPWLESRHDATEGVPPLPQVQGGPILLVPRPGSVQSNLRLGRSAPTRSDPDWPAAVLANLAFGGLFASRLVENLRERHGYTYSPGSSFRHGRAGSALVISADVGVDVTAAALLETRYELGRIAVEGIADEEVEAARRYAIGTFTFLTATQSGLADTLATLTLAGIGPGYLGSYPASLHRTTRAEVEAAARHLLSPTGFATVVVGDVDEVGGGLAAVDAVRLASG